MSCAVWSRKGRDDVTLYEIDSGILELCALLDAAPDTGEVGAGCEDILARLDILHFRRVAIFLR